MKRNLTSGLGLLLALVMLLSACGRKDPTPTDPMKPTTPPVTVSETVLPTETQPMGPFNEGLDALRQKMEPSAAIAGVMFLGVNESDSLNDAFPAVLDKLGYALEYPFMLEIPAERQIQATGYEIYCIIPADPNAHVTVTAWDELNESQKAGKLLYQSNQGDPFLIQCNVSDIMSNVAITITDTLGNVLTQYHPYISLKDGGVGPSADDQPVVLDLTPQYDPDKPVYHFDLYFPNEAKTAFETQRMDTQVMDEGFVLSMLTEHRVLPDGIQILQFREEGKQLYLDLNVAFADYLNSLTGTEKDLVLGSVINSYLSAYGLETITICVEGTPMDGAYSFVSIP